MRNKEFIDRLTEELGVRCLVGYYGYDIRDAILNRVENINSRKNFLQRNNGFLQAEIEGLLASNKSLRDDMEELRDDRDELQREIERLQKKLGRWGAQEDAIDKANELIVEHNNKLKRDAISKTLVELGKLFDKEKYVEIIEAHENIYSENTKDIEYLSTIYTPNITVNGIDLSYFSGVYMDNSFDQKSIYTAKEQAEAILIFYRKKADVL